MMATETDLLLPRDKPAPEIHGSSSRIINVEATGVDAAEIDIDERPRIGVNEIIGFCAAILTVSFILIAIIPDGFFKHLFPGWHQPLTLDGRVSKILTDTPLIDGHNDLAILLRVLYNNHINDEKFRRPFEDGGMPFHVDIPRLKKGMVGGTFWAAFAPCPANGSDFSEENYEDSE
jgi:membrane dipeptidase